ncbi:MAG TPA: NADH-quinone oxidoreductase subunit NuoE [Deltaproteobacteria bacterium]|nr:NADH-quinone oxidoreductase subunit NuoE [Deltaproteobacteria bacterium]
MKAVISEIRKESKGKPEELIPLLQRVQSKMGFLPEKALMEIAGITGLSPAKVYGVASFFAQFRFHPAGKHMVRICRGTACHVKGSNRILNDIETHFKLEEGETTEDMLFTLETVACFGSCALAPVVLVDETVRGRMNPSKTRSVLEEIKKESEGATSDPS